MTLSLLRGTKEGRSALKSLADIEEFRTNTLLAVVALTFGAVVAESSGVTNLTDLF